ncbi:MAG: serine hydrolase domain-containing protein [Hyphomonadaceae bacterium]
MNARSAILAAMLAVCVLAAPAHAQDEPIPQLPPPAINAGMSDADLSRGLDAWLADLSQSGDFNGVVLVARDGREIYAGAHGVTDLDTNTALNAETRFALASIGKAFTHVAVAQLIQQGRLSPDDTISEVLPDYPNAVSRTATVAQLINHRAGIADIMGPAARDIPVQQFASNHDYYLFVAQQPPLFAPGEAEEYCNGCYVVLAEIVARVSGQSYEEYLAQNVFAPAGMTSTAFLRHDQLPPNSARFTGRPRGPGTPLQDVSRFHGVSGSGAGNVYSTARDLLAFDNALREHRLLDAELTAQVLRGEVQSGRATIRRGFAGGAPGVNTVILGNGAWTLVVLTNRPPPTAEAIGQAVFPLLAGPRPQ